MARSSQRPFPKSYWVEPGRLLAGEYPASYDAEASRLKLRALLDCGIDTLVDLTEPGELEPYEEILSEISPIQPLAVRQNFPILDFSVPTREEMRRILDALDEMLAAGKTVYVHCFGGSGRTGTVIGCWLVRRGLSGDQALQRIRELRKVIPEEMRRPSPETLEQAEMVRTWRE